MVQVPICRCGMIGVFSSPVIWHPMHWAADGGGLWYGAVFNPGAALIKE